MLVRLSLSSLFCQDVSRVPALVVGHSTLPKSQATNVPNRPEQQRRHSNRPQWHPLRWIRLLLMWGECVLPWGWWWWWWWFCRAGDGTAAEAKDVLRNAADRHPKPVEEHRSPVRELVSAVSAASRNLMSWNEPHKRVIWNTLHRQKYQSLY